MNIKNKITLLLFGIVECLYSQSYDNMLNQFSFPSISNPDVYAFEKHNLAEMNLYTGKANVSIPLYTIETGNIKYPLILSYDTGGIKVDQLASDVGLGWNLSKAIITRIVNDKNDFNNVGVLHKDPNYVFSAGEQTKNQDVWSKDRSVMGFFLRKQLNATLWQRERNMDFLPDLYKFYGSDFSTSFYFQDVNTPVELNPKGTKVQAVKGKQLFNSGLSFGGGVNLYEFPTQDFFSITITTPNGIKYVFNNYDVSATYNVGPNPYLYYEANSLGIGNPISTNPPQISTWHISEIEDTNTGKKINFHYDITHSNPFQSGYDVYTSSYDCQRSITYRKTTVAPQTHYFNCPRFYAGEQSSQYNYTYDITARVDIQKARLKKITFDEGEIEFYYNAQEDIGFTRDDIYNGNMLSRLDVKNNKGSIIKKFIFNYSYFLSNYNVGEFNLDGGPGSPYRYKRLKLSSVQEEGLPPYVFTYNENIKLPPINSFSIDFLGYYNNSPDVSSLTVLNNLQPNPTLYYFPNNQEKTLLPFQPYTAIPSPIQFSIIQGYFNRESNDYTKAWSLKNILYPSGALMNLEYELNEFEIFGQNVKGGGLRVKKQSLTGDSGDDIVMEYEYKDINGDTSGVLENTPYFGHPMMKLFEVEYIYSQEMNEELPIQINPITEQQGWNGGVWRIFDKSNLLEDITSGAYVGYSRVVEKNLHSTEHNRTEYLFTSGKEQGFNNIHFKPHPSDAEQDMGEYLIGQLNNYTCIADFLKSNTGMGSEVFTDNSYKRGKLLETNMYNDTNELVKKVKNIYQENLLNNNRYYSIVTGLDHTASENNVNYMFAVMKNYKIVNYLLSSTETTEYFNTGNLTTVESYTYNNNATVKSMSNINSTGETILTNIYYPNDVSSISSLPGGNITSNQLNAVNRLKSNNSLSSILQTEQLKNNTLTERTRILFKNWGTTKVLPEILQKSKENQNLEIITKINLVDTSNGNYLEIQQEEGTKTSYVWGYNKTLIVAKIENMSYTSIPSNIITDIQTLSNNNDESSLIDALNALRDNPVFANTLITTYTHKPLVGITSITDPRGYTTTYEYDSLGRLKFVRDENGNILNENQYNYRAQN